MGLKEVGAKAEYCTHLPRDRANGWLF